MTYLFFHLEAGFALSLGLSYSPLLKYLFISAIDPREVLKNSLHLPSYPIVS